LLDQKSKQKNQEKIIPAFTHRALRPAAIFSGHRALDLGLFKASSFKLSQDNRDYSMESPEKPQLFQACRTRSKMNYQYHNMSVNHFNRLLDMNPKDS
jgi:hypothetical protein